MSLALALLRRGRVEPVLEYMDRCASFWDAAHSRLPNWEAIVRRGEIPDFGGNLVYGMGTLKWEDEPEEHESEEGESEEGEPER